MRHPTYKRKLSIPYKKIDNDDQQYTKFTYSKHFKNCDNSHIQNTLKIVIH